MKEWDKAVSAAQSCIDLKKRFGGGWLELGIAEMGKNNKTRAKRHFEEARKDRDWRKMAERKIDEINNPAKYEPEGPPSILFSSSSSFLHPYIPPYYFRHH